MIRILGTFALYYEKEYEFQVNSDGTYAIFSCDPETLKLGFKRIVKDIDRFIKEVELNELSLIYEKDTEVIYKGHTFIGSVIEDNKIMLYTRNSILGKKYNMNMRDKDEYYLYVDLKDVDKIIQNCIPYKEFKCIK